MDRVADIHRSYRGTCLTVHTCDRRYRRSMWQAVVGDGVRRDNYYRICLVDDVSDRLRSDAVVVGCSCERPEVSVIRTRIRVSGSADIHRSYCGSRLTVHTRDRRYRRSVWQTIIGDVVRSNNNYRIRLSH